MNASVTVLPIINHLYFNKMEKGKNHLKWFEVRRLGAKRRAADLVICAENSAPLILTRQHQSSCDSLRSSQHSVSVALINTCVALAFGQVRICEERSDRHHYQRYVILMHRRFAPPLLALLVAVGHYDDHSNCWVHACVVLLFDDFRIRQHEQRSFELQPR